MNRTAALVAAATLALSGMATSAQAATTIDFESAALGSYSSLTLSGVTFTSSVGFDVADASPGDPIVSHSLINWFKGEGGVFRADFAAGASAVSIGMGDYNSDDDEGHLEAYDATGNLLASDYLFVPAPVYGGGMLSVSSASPIAYVLFYETGSYPGAVYWDNMSVTAAVPEPATYGLMALGLAAVGAFARRRRG